MNSKEVNILSKKIKPILNILMMYSVREETWRLK